MPYLVDGNNVLFAARDDDPERPPGRQKLCETLGRWAERYRHRLRVVFDGPAPAGPLAEQIAHAAIDVEFSGAGVSADDVIRARIAEDTAPRRLVVVSSDREVARAARRREARALGSAEFWARVVDELDRPPPAPRLPREKTEGLLEGERDEWLREMGFD